jgi:D-glycero-alpha-D-manno-heptose-7-phosphate kinase
MILVRSPLRLTLGGGGSDRPSYVAQHGGFSLTAAINQYVHVAVLRPFHPGVYLKYSELERVVCVDAVQHPIFREALQHFKIAPQIEITTLADIPAGTGLGSSSSFTTALIKALATHERLMLSTQAVADLACEIEINRLHAPIGKQDQYAAAFGGVCSLTFNPDGTVAVEPLPMSATAMQALEDGLVLFYTGLTRSTNDVLAQPATDAILTRVKELGWRSRDALCAGKLYAFGHLLHTHWLEKSARGLSTPEIDQWYRDALTHGAIGGKLVGAGGGGFLLCYTESPRELRRGLAGSGLQEVRFRFDFDGTRVVLS